MNNQFDEMAKGLAQSVTQRAAIKKFGVGIVGIGLACFYVANITQAQTSVVCDRAGDAAYSFGKGGPAVPPWLDIVQGVVSDSNENILFTLTVNAPIPFVPSWSGVDDSGQFWWGFRMIGDLANMTFAKNGCIASNGYELPAVYYLDVIWSVADSNFHANLIDNTSCTQVAIPFWFSTDRSQITMVVAKSLLSNTALIPNPDTFQYLATTAVWKSDTIGNLNFHHVDWAPDLSSSGGLVLATWSSSSNASYFCP